MAMSNYLVACFDIFVLEIKGVQDSKIFCSLVGYGYWIEVEIVSKKRKKKINILFK